MAVDRGEFGITEGDVISTIERAAAVARPGCDDYARAWVGDRWIDVVSASRSAMTAGWELVTPGGGTYLVPVNVAVFYFGHWI